MTVPFHTLRDPAYLPSELSNPVLAIGNFDGVHLGHQTLIKRAVALAERLAKPIALLTFDPHPRGFFRPDEPIFKLTTAEQKADYAAAAGAHGMVSLTFNSQLSALSAEEFVRDILVKRLGTQGAVIGYDFHFGKGRTGSASGLADMGRTYGFVTETVEPFRVAGEIVSSSLIRSLLMDGDVAKANSLLGREWTIRAEVAHGDKRGRELGYPTANLHLDKTTALKHGIYAVRATFDGKTHPAVASFGRRPTFDDGAPKLEVHLFDFAGDLYGKQMDVSFVGFIRPELKFDGVKPLIAQMDKDSITARSVLAAPLLVTP
jgi:riboflavin kinase / FMN adenylyltransferase